MKPKVKKPIVAWLVKVEGIDGAGLACARTEAGARGFLLRDIREESGIQTARKHVLEASRLGPMDDWAATHDPGVIWDLQIALYQEQDARKESLRAALAATFPAMRKEGLGLSMGQEEALARGVGL